MVFSDCECSHNLFLDTVPRNTFLAYKRADPPYKMNEGRRKSERESANPPIGLSIALLPSSPPFLVVRHIFQKKDIFEPAQQELGFVDIFPFPSSSHHGCHTINSPPRRTLASQNVWWKTKQRSRLVVEQGHDPRKSTQIKGWGWRHRF